MKKQHYAHMQILLPASRATLAEGKTQDGTMAEKSEYFLQSQNGAADHAEV